MQSIVFGAKHGLKSLAAALPNFGSSLAHLMTSTGLDFSGFKLASASFSGFCLLAMLCGLCACPFAITLPRSHIVELLIEGLQSLMVVVVP